jgi:hypothetical protein
MPNASDERGVAPAFCPIDRFPLSFEGTEHVVGVVFDNEIVDTIPLRAPLRACFNENIRHNLFSLLIFGIGMGFARSPCLG